MFVTQTRSLPDADGSSQAFTFRRHQHLARAGERPARVFRVMAGWAAGYRLLADGRRQITDIFLPGDYCEPQWFLSRVATSSMVALTDVCVRGIPLDMLTDPSLSPGGNGYEMLIAILQLLNRKSDWIVALGRMTAMERVGYLISDLFSRLRAGGQVRRGRCAMPLTQSDLADAAGLTPVHVNRVLQVFRARGLLQLDHKTLYVPDLEALRRGATAQSQTLPLSAQKGAHAPRP